jgi:acyl-CoA synthetase (AMP-forming)/AMP-acid ligase II
MTEGSGAGATVTDLLLASSRHGDRPCFALVSADDGSILSSLTFAGAVEAGKRASGALRAAGVEPGDRVLIAARPGPAWITTFIGAVFAGAVAVPVNHHYRQREFAALIGACSPVVVVVDDGTRAAATAALEKTGSGARLIDLEHDDLLSGVPREPVKRDPADLAVILHTSGTTGVPKGVERTHGAYAMFMRRWSEQSMRPDDRVLNFLPLYHQAGLLCSFLSGFTLGIPVFHVERFDRTTFWSTVDAHALTWGILMQPVPRYLLDDAAGEGAHSHSLRWVVATVMPEDWTSFQTRFGVAVHSSYGSTETTIVRVTGSRADGPVDPGRIHGPLGGALCGRRMSAWADVRVVTDEGRRAAPNQPGFIEVRGGPVFGRYFQNTEATGDAFRDDGWFRTGDFGYITPEDELYFLDRVSGLIRRSGENIAPRELEELLEDHPGVAEAAVIGVPDELRGQEIAAFVVPRPSSGLSEDELFAFCQDQLAHFKVPRFIELRQELPHTPTFKVQRDALELSDAAADRRSADRRRVPTGDGAADTDSQR